MHAKRQSLPMTHHNVTIDIADALSPADLNDLCDATDASIEAGGGFGWIRLPAREVMERFWKGVLVVPERHLLLARVDGVVCGAAQLIEPSRHNEAQSFSANIIAAFVAPWARGQGAGRKLLETTEKLAAEMGYKVLNADIRATQEAAIALFEASGYKKWGENPTYAVVNDKIIRGLYYSKMIAPLDPSKTL